MENEEENGSKSSAHLPEDKRALGIHLAHAREAAGQTQESTATALGLVKQTISSWENGRNLPDALWLRRLARLYETSVDSLVGHETAPAWPFSDELQQHTQSLNEYKRLALERAMWVHLDEPVPKGVEDRLSELRTAARSHLDAVSTVVHSGADITAKGKPLRKR